MLGAWEFLCNNYDKYNTLPVILFHCEGQQAVGVSQEASVAAEI